MKIAFATQDQQRVDAHFGWAKHLAVYEISPHGYQFLQDFEFGDDLAEDGNEDKLSPKLAAIADCAIVYVAAIGGSAAARVVASKIHPVKVSQPEPILDILDKLQDTLAGTPPPWLRKALSKDQPRSLDFEDDDEVKKMNATVDAVANSDILKDDFVLELIKQIRAQDTHGTWEGKSDAKLLEPFIVTAEQRRAMPIMGDPDPDTLWRLDLFHNAVGLTIERATKCMVTPMMKMSHEGFGRAVLTTGRLIVVNRYLRDVHRFGFLSLDKLAEAGHKLVKEGVDLINQYPEVAHYG